MPGDRGVFNEYQPMLDGAIDRAEFEVVAVQVSIVRRFDRGRLPPDKDAMQLLGDAGKYDAGRVRFRKGLGRFGNENPPFPDDPEWSSGFFDEFSLLGDIREPAM
jgi:hypothetical protein